MTIEIEGLDSFFEYHESMIFKSIKNPHDQAQARAILLAAKEYTSENNPKAAICLQNFFKFMRKKIERGVK